MICFYIIYFTIPKPPNEGLRELLIDLFCQFEMLRLCLKAPIWEFGGHIQNITLNIIFNLYRVIVYE